MKNMSFAGRWVLVTGASSGLGREIARTLAFEHKAHVVLVARRGDRLRALAQEIEAAGTKAHVLEADLSQEADVDRVFDEATALGEIYGVVLNAGVTYFGEHQGLQWKDFQSMLATNVTSVVRLTSLFAPYLAERKNEGGILLVASMAGLIPVPYQSAYSGTKAFLVHFGRALSEELRGKPVSVTTFAPGGIVTDMTESAGLSTYFKSSLAMMDARTCARAAVRGFSRRDYVHVPGLFNRLGALLGRWLPQRLFGAAIGAQYRKALAMLPAAARE